MKDKADAWVQNWDSICKLGKENNFETIVFLQPVLGTGEKPMSEWEKYKIETQGYTSVVPYYTNLQEKIHVLNKNVLLLMMYLKYSMILKNQSISQWVIWEIVEMKSSQMKFLY